MQHKFAEFYDAKRIKSISLLRLIAIYKKIHLGTDLLWCVDPCFLQFLPMFIQWPTLLYCSYFSERLWSSNSVRPCASVFNFIFLVLIGFILVLRVVALISISHSYGWMAGCLSPVFMFPPIFIIFSSYFIYFKSSV